ncbi:MAG TPA: DUF58 domain-containing protein [Gaiellaceae bacterium]|nr:DUF58 domain-containing protein [Gaiellaceae bacterium]
MRSARLSFPLVPRRRVIGVSFGTMRSLRRGAGSDVAGSRPYRPGDPFDIIDWNASARLSTARGGDEFVVRERFAEEAPRIVVVCDRRPQMAHHRRPLPWLDKPRAMRHAVELILASAGAAGGFVGYLDYGDGRPHWRPPKGERKLLELRDERLWAEEFGGPPDWLERALAHLAEHPRAVTPGTFVFCLSDFLPPPPRDLWLAAVARRWDLVPVVIQDPTWEQSFPDAAGIVLPLLDPASGRAVEVRLTRREAAERRQANEARFRRLLDDLSLLGLDPVAISSSELPDVLASFLVWAELRRVRRVAGAWGG